MNAALEHISVTWTLSVPTQLVHITVLVNQDTVVTVLFANVKECFLL